MYIDGSSVTHGDPARLWSSMCHFDGPLCLHFWYHMYGSATAMALNMYLLKDKKATKLWVMMNNQGPQWHLGLVDIRVDGPFQIIIEGIRGSNALSDVAIDDISIHFGSCSGSLPGLITGTKPSFTTVDVLPPLQICNVDCSFDSNLCSWNQMVTDAFDWTWQSGSTPTLMTGPSAGHTGDGHYLYIEASNVTHGNTARLISAECSASGPKCLQFWYHMYGSADTMGLHVYLLQDRLADAVWWKRNDQGNVWQLAQVDIRTTGAFQIIFEGRRGSNEESDVAIDDVKLYHGQCSDESGVVTSPPETSAEPPVNMTAQPPAADITTPPTVEAQTNYIDGGNVTEALENRPPPHSVCQLNCNFEEDLCQWNQLLTDVFDWTRHSGSTPTMMTGPSSDHTTGVGHYLYIEANSVSHGDTARLISAECSDSGPRCLQFWYHMYGSADTLGLHVYLFQNRKANAVWWKRNDQGNMWQLAQVDLTTSGIFQIIFEGRRGSNDQSDVAIDDVSLHYGHCTAATVGPTFPPPNNSTSLKPQTTLTTAFSTSNTNPDLQTTRPQPPIPTSRPQTTATPYPPTTAHAGLETTKKPEPAMTEGPEQPATSTDGPQTTAGREPTAGSRPPTTVGPQPSTEIQPEPQTTPQRPTTAQPQPTTVKPQPTTTQPQPTTVKPQPTTTQPQPTTAQPQPTTAQPQPTTTQPQPTTTQPQPTTTQPQPTTAQPQPTTAQPQPTITQPQPTITQPQPTTTQPQPTTVKPQPTTTAGPHPPTTNRPRPTTTAETQPPTSYSTTPSCPEKSHYTACVPPCSPTCTHLNGQPGCSSNSGCEQGCVCDEGFVYKSRACVPIRQCGCVDGNGTGHHFNEVWYTNHCSQKCECKKDRGVGKIDCNDKDECDGNAVCLQNVEGDYYCQSTDFSECTIRRDPEFRTFDKLKHEFNGKHSYVLVRTNNLPNYLPQVYVEGINDDDDDSHGDSSSEEHHSHSESDEDDDEYDDDDDDDARRHHHNSDEHEQHYRLQALKIRVYGHTVVFKKNRRLIVDGRETNTPASPTAGLSIRERSSRLYLETDFGLSVEFDGHNTAEIILPHLYKRKVGGLCGNFDGHRRNDWMKPDGTRARRLEEFGESWRV